MNEQRFVVSDVFWQRLKSYLPGKLSVAGATAKDNHLFLKAVLRRVRNGALWRDLPHAFGHWNSQFRRFRRWAKSGVLKSLFKAVSEYQDLEYALIDGTNIEVHQKATGPKGGHSIRPLGAHAVGERQRSSRWWMRSAIWFGFCCCRGQCMR